MRYAPKKLSFFFLFFFIVVFVVVVFVVVVVVVVVVVFRTSLSFVGSWGIEVAFGGKAQHPKSSATHCYQCVQYFPVSKQCYCCQCLGFLTCTHRLMRAIAHWGCTDYGHRKRVVP